MVRLLPSGPDSSFDTDGWRRSVIANRAIRSASSPSDWISPGLSNRNAVLTVADGRTISRRGATAAGVARDRRGPVRGWRVLAVDEVAEVGKGADGVEPRVPLLRRWQDAVECARQHHERDDDERRALELLGGLVRDEPHHVEEDAAAGAAGDRAADQDDHAAGRS